MGGGELWVCGRGGRINRPHGSPRGGGIGIEAVVSLRREVAKRLADGRLDEIAAMSDESKNVISAVVSRLYEADALLRWRAADALGRVTSRVAQRDPGAIRELLKKLAWSLNEESGATAWGAPQAIGEVTRRDPELSKEYYPLLISYLHHDEVYLETDILVHGVLHSLGRLAEGRDGLGVNAVEPLMGLLRDGDATTRGMAVWALGRIGDGRAREALSGMVGDEARLERYEDGEMVETTVGELAREGLGRLG